MANQNSPGQLLKHTRSAAAIPVEMVAKQGKPVVISEAVQALPQMHNPGMVRNLRADVSPTGIQAEPSHADAAIA